MTTAPSRAEAGELSGAVVVVTGSSTGIGRALASRLAAASATVIGCARRSAAPIEGVEQHELDLSLPGAIAELIARAAERGPIDAWVNNAGSLGRIGPLADVEADELMGHVALNVASIAEASAAFADHVRSRPGPGVLINLSSGAASSPRAGWAMYCASKAYIDMLTRTLALETEDGELRVYSVAPGVVDTDMQSQIRQVDERRFPSRQLFVEMHRRGELRHPDEVAVQLVELLAGRWHPDEVVLRLS